MKTAQEISCAVLFVNALDFYNFQNLLTPLCQRDAAFYRAGVVSRIVKALQRCIVIDADEFSFFKALQNQSGIFRIYGSYIICLSSYGEERNLTKLTQYVQFVLRQLECIAATAAAATAAFSTFAHKTCLPYLVSWTIPSIYALVKKVCT